MGLPTSILFSMVSLCLACCASIWATAAAAQEVNPFTVQLKWKHQFQFAGFYAALHQGYYRDAGLDVTLREWTGNIDPMEEVLSGRADAGVGAANILEARLKGKPVVVLAAIFQRSPLAILALKSSGIATPQDLAGKRLGMTLHSDLELWAMLRMAGVRVQHVTVVDDPPNRVRDLLEGKVDAISGYLSAQAPLLQERGLDPVVLRPSTYDIEFYGDTLFASEAVVRARGREVDAFVRATLKGWEYALAHPDVVVDDILTHYTPEADRAALLREAEAVRRLIAPDRAPLGAVELVRWQTMAQELLALGYAGDVTRLEGLIHTPVKEHMERALRVVVVAAAVALLALLGVLALLVANRRMAREMQRRLQAEAQARETGRLLEGMLTQLPVVLLRVNREQEVLFCRGQGLRRLGLEDDALVGRRLDLVYPRLAQGMAAAGNGEVASFVTQGGSSDAPWQLEVYAFLDADGCVTAFALDSTAVLESERVRVGLLALLESAPDIIAMADATGRVLYLNTAGKSFFEVTEAEASRMLLTMLHPSEMGLRMVAEAIPAAMEQGLWMGETMLRNWKGREMPVSQLIIAHKDADGVVRNLFTVCRDLSARMEMESELKAVSRRAQAASQAKSEFLAHMSHEIRTPLNGLLGMLQLLSLTPLSEEQREYVQTGLASGRGLVTILTDILDLSRIESGRMMLERKPLHVRELVEELALLFRNEAQSKGLGFRVWVDPATPATILGDAGRLRQVLFNLLGNAVKFTDSGDVALDVVAVLPKTGEDGVRSGGALVFQITDAGPGIVQQDIPHLFEAFVQQHTSGEKGEQGKPTRRKKGLGLGLAVVARIVKLMGGTVLVASLPGEGSEFTVTIPCDLPGPEEHAPQPLAQQMAPPAQPSPDVSQPVPQPASQQESQQESRPESHMPQENKPSGFARLQKKWNGTSLRILVAEDEPTNRFTMETYLGRRGHQVTTAADGEEALALGLTGQFDVVLLDIQLPKRSGMDVARALRAQGVTTPLVAISAFALQGDRERFMEAGMSEYLSKPLDFKALDALLHECAPANARESAGTPLLATD